MSEQPHIVILGGGFGGLSAARALADAPVRVTVVDRKNHHLFQPLLYQVATVALSPGDIASPIRWVLWRQDNTRVVLGEATAIDVCPCVVQVQAADRCCTLGYEHLIVATGATHAYFGHDEWRDTAPGLKTLSDTLRIRHRVLLAFGRAEQADDPQMATRLLTFVVIGGGRRAAAGGCAGRDSAGAPRGRHHPPDPGLAAVAAIPLSQSGKPGDGRSRLGDRRLRLVGVVGHRRLAGLAVRAYLEPHRLPQRDCRHDTMGVAVSHLPAQRALDDQAG